MCRRGNKHFDVDFWRIRLVQFSLKDGRDAAYEVRNGWKSVYFPPDSEFFVFMVNIIKVVLFLIYTLTWRVNNYVSRHPKGINRRNESTISIMIIVEHCTNYIE